VKRLLSLILAASLGAAFSFPAHSEAKSATFAPHVIHATGLTRTSFAAETRGAHQFHVSGGATTVPASVDLSQWDPSTGDQSQVGSCVDWAEGYYYRYWLLAHDQGIRLTGSFAPMYLYTRAGNHSQDGGSTFEDGFALLQSEGIAPDNQYTAKPSDSNGPHAGRYDYLDDPNATDHQNAAPYKISGYSYLFTPTMTPQQKIDAVKGAIASGHPVLFGISVYEPFMYAGSNYPAVVQPGGNIFYGNHAVFSPAYTSTGAEIQNQWGTNGWGTTGPNGQGGWATLSWTFIGSADTFQAYVMAAPQPAPTSTPTPRPTSTPAPTATPIFPTATATSTPSPTVTPAPHGHCRWWRSAPGGKGRCKWWVSRRKS
jgi:hypothetical protein